MITIILAENRALYLSVVERDFPEWNIVNKNKIVLMAVDAFEQNNEILKNAYISAIMLYYWYKIDQFYKRCKLVVTPEDCHFWLVQSVLYAVEKHPWTDKNSSLYGVKNAPEIVIHRFMESRRLTFYQQLNRYNRKINSAILSLDNLEEDYSDTYAPCVEDDDTFIYCSMIKDFFQKEDYLKSIILDIILFDPTFADEFNRKKLVTFLKSIGDSYIKLFSNKYDVDENKMRDVANMIKNLSHNSLTTKVKSTLLYLRNDFRDLR